MKSSQAEILRAIRALGGDDLEARLAARKTLESADQAATWHLIQALAPPSERTRREAIKILAHRADPESLETFVTCLEDQDSACRWHAAEGLVALGRIGLDRILELLETYPGTDTLLRGAHHVLQGLAANGYRSLVAPVLQAFQSTTPQIDVPAAASHARLAPPPAERATERPTEETRGGTT